MNREELLSRMQSDAKELLYYTFDAESVSEAVYYFAASGFIGEELNEKIKELLAGCRHSGDLWNWLYHHGIYD